jgi:hypothetical protein
MHHPQCYPPIPGGEIRHGVTVREHTKAADGPNNALSKCPSKQPAIAIEEAGETRPFCCLGSICRVQTLSLRRLRCRPWATGRMIPDRRISAWCACLASWASGAASHSAKVEHLLGRPWIRSIFVPEPDQRARAAHHPALRASYGPMDRLEGSPRRAPPAPERRRRGSFAPRAGLTAARRRP